MSLLKQMKTAKASRPNPSLTIQSLLIGQGDLNGLPVFFMTLSPAARRKKGHDFERRVAADLRKMFPDAKRGLQTRNNVDLAPDVDVPHFFVECKAQKQCNIRAALRQATEKRKEDDERMAVAVCKDDRKPIMVTMLYDDWLKLIKLAF